VLQIRKQLQIIKNWDLLIDAYLIKIPRSVDTLRTAGVSVSRGEIILYILGELDTDYKAIVAVISSQLETITLPTVHTLLTNQEIRNSKVRNSQSAFSINASNYNSKRDRETRLVYQICDADTSQFPFTTSITNLFIQRLRSIERVRKLR